eukprot:CAMPEP_0168433606 /NCGR_PEP_ID=MMETSP0228-20121227/39482_1 /TAXON_ID=133427 /ORGANISM="Protoceratium reticulatum, Strain CCCM 535 (=CCMP 1889)" /LENGTH=87 /DNA_ID=CAMNT_0008447747 /DNA_START=38 /DNA_END=301 /DNA_ORIENTATION=+
MTRAVARGSGCAQKPSSSCPAPSSGTLTKRPSNAPMSSESLSESSWIAPVLAGSAVLCLLPPSLEKVVFRFLLFASSSPRDQAFSPP